MSFLIPAAYADAAAPAAAAGPMGTGFEWVFLVGFLVIFYLMIWRPQGLLPMTRPQLKLKNGETKGEQA